MKRRVYSKDTDAAQIPDQAQPQGSGGRGVLPWRKTLGLLGRGSRLEESNSSPPPYKSAWLSPQEPIHSGVVSTAVPS